MRNKIELVRKKIEALNAELKEEGLSIAIDGAINYDDATMGFKVLVVESTGACPRHSIFNANCAVYGLTPADYGRKVLVEGKEFKLVGVFPRAKKFFYEIEREDGKLFKAAQFKFI